MLPTVPTGHDVRTLRSHLGLSLDKFAHAIGATVQTVYRWERYGANPIPPRGTLTVRNALPALLDAPPIGRFRSAHNPILGRDVSRTRFAAAPIGALFYVWFPRQPAGTPVEWLPDRWYLCRKNTRHGMAQCSSGATPSHPFMVRYDSFPPRLAQKKIRN